MTAQRALQSPVKQAYLAKFIFKTPEFKVSGNCPKDI
jgi:hypothetical protein